MTTHAHDDAAQHDHEHADGEGHRHDHGEHAHPHDADTHPPSGIGTPQAYGHSHAEGHAHDHGQHPDAHAADPDPSSPQAHAHSHAEGHAHDHVEQSHLADTHPPSVTGTPQARGHSHADGDGHAHPHEHTAGGGLREQLQHLIAPHSHDHADSIDDALTSTSAGIRAVQLSLIGLAVTAAFQLAVALASGSVAVLADTIHNFADASTAIPLWLAFAIGRKKPTPTYTYGYGRAEDLAGVFVLLMIVVSAVIAAYESIQKLLQPTRIDNLGWVALAGLAGFVGNEAVAQYRIRTGQRIGSAALVADGYHARTDGLTSLSVLLGAAGVWLGFPIADPIIGLAITIAILLVLKDSALQMWRRLMDAVDPQLIAQATEAAQHAEGVQDVSTVRARWIGHAIHAEALIVADSNLKLSEAHRVAERARHAMLHAVPRLNSVTVHVDPSNDGSDHHAELAHHDRHAIGG